MYTIACLLNSALSEHAVPPLARPYLQLVHQSGELQAQSRQSPTSTSLLPEQIHKWIKTVSNSCSQPASPVPVHVAKQRGEERNGGKCCAAMTEALQEQALVRLETDHT